MIPRREEGFTLSELLLATAILAFVISSLLLLFVKCILLNEENRNLTAATAHNQFIMEEIKNTDYSNIASVYGGVCLDAAALNSRGLSHLNNETICVSVNSTNFLDIALNNNWTDRGGRSRSAVLRTLITEP